MARPSARTVRGDEDTSSGVVETPSKKLIRENTKANTHTVEDDLGRVIVYKNLTPLEQCRLFKAIGDLSSNQMYCQMAMTAASVQTIDGHYGPPAVSVLSLEARVDWIGTEGYNSVWLDIRKRVEDIVNEKTPEEIAEEHSATLKKSDESDSQSDVSD